MSGADIKKKERHISPLFPTGRNNKYLRLNDYIDPTENGNKNEVTSGKEDVPDNIFDSRDKNYALPTTQNTTQYPYWDLQEMETKFSAIRENLRKRGIIRISKRSMKNKEERMTK